jgi:hypothetical protein
MYDFNNGKLRLQFISLIFASVSAAFINGTLLWCPREHFAMSAGKSARNAAQLCSPRGPWLLGIRAGYLCFPSDAAALIEIEQMLSLTGEPRLCFLQLRN